MQGRLRLALAAAACVAVWVLVGWVIGLLARAPVPCLLIGLMVGLFFLLFCSFASDRFALDMYDGTLLDADQAPRLYEMVQEISAEAGIEPPLLFALPSQAPNAFAISRRQGTHAVAVTNGLTQRLDREEVRAVMALMVARLAGGQAGAWTLATTLAGIPLSWARSAGINDTLGNTLTIDPNAGLTAVGRFVLSLLIPPAVLVLKIAFDPGDVGRADRAAARLLDDPAALAGALRKIGAGVPIHDGRVLDFYPSSALLFAVPPLPPVRASAGAPLWVRAQAWFPYYAPTPAERAERFLDAVPPAGSAREGAPGAR